MRLARQIFCLARQKTAGILTDFKVFQRSPGRKFGGKTCASMDSVFLKALLRIVNAPKRRGFFRHTALKILAIHRVFLQIFALSGEKIPCRWAYGQFQTRPNQSFPKYSTVFGKNNCNLAGNCSEAVNMFCRRQDSPTNLRASPVGTALEMCYTVSIGGQRRRRGREKSNFTEVCTL